MHIVNGKHLPQSQQHNCYINMKIFHKSDARTQQFLWYDICVFERCLQTSSTGKNSTEMFLPSCFCFLAFITGAPEPAREYLVKQTMTLKIQSPEHWRTEIINQHSTPTWNSAKNLVSLNTVNWVMHNFLPPILPSDTNYDRLSIHVWNIANFCAMVIETPLKENQAGRMTLRAFCDVIITSHAS